MAFKASEVNIYISYKSLCLYFNKFSTQIHSFEPRKLKLGMWSIPVGAEVMGYLRSASAASEAV